MSTAIAVPTAPPSLAGPPPRPDLAPVDLVLGMLGHPPAAPTSGPVATCRATCRAEGDVWLFEFEGRSTRLRASRGLTYLAQLLRQPGRPVHCVDLARLGRGLPGTARRPDDARLAITLGGAEDSSPDRRACRDYRARLADLQESLDEAERNDDLGRAALARREMDVLLLELGRASRRSPAGSHAERARLAVTKAMKAALARVDGAHPPLGSHLQATIRRGYWCVYRPDPRHPIVWEA